MGPQGTGAAGANRTLGGEASLTVSLPCFSKGVPESVWRDGSPEMLYAHRCFRFGGQLALLLPNPACFFPSHPDIIVLGPLRRTPQCFYLLPQTMDCRAPEGQVAVGSTRKGHWNRGRSPPGMCRMRHHEARGDAAPGTQEPCVRALFLFTRLTVILGGSGYVFSLDCLWEYGGSGRCTC